MTLERLLDRWRQDPEIARNITAWKTIPGRQPRLKPLPEELHSALVLALQAQGIEALYTHQAAAWRAMRQGENPVIVTGTASGKSLGYNLPVLDRLLRDPQATALYLFPTKALAQDQESALRALLGGQQVVTPPALATYDGDTPAKVRQKVRQEARLVISNPDMLHLGVLPHHTRWAGFLRGLAFVVIDEMHTYRGVFGSHVANVLRRLKRVAQFYGASPRFCLTSATIANPQELAERLIEAPVRLIDRDGSARGARHFLIYNPPLVDPELGLRRGALSESVRLASDLLAYDLQTILFARTRRAVELALSYLRREVTAAPEAVRGYRSGYLPRERRAIEAGLRQGEVRAVVATTALELGVDIGGMAAAVLSGYPGTIAGTWQQAGRAGRGKTSSLALLVASANPLDQFLARHPDYFFDQSPENALIDPNNLLILLNHLRCAAFELPFRKGEAFGRVPAEQVEEFLQFMHQTGEVHRSGEQTYWVADSYPAQDTSLRSASAQRVLLQADEGGAPVVVGEVDQESARWMVHPGAVYLHEGHTYRVENLDLEAGIAHLTPAELDYYTEPRSETSVELLEQLEEAPVVGGSKAHGEILVTTQVIGYQKILWETHERVDTLDLDLPPTELQTTGYWLALADETVDQLRAVGLWSNDPNDYGPSWKQQRDRARARDGYRCQICGAPEGETAHHVHHKIPFRTFASARAANQLANLVTLCPACHRRVETVVRVRSGLAGLAYTLGHLAPLFLMCDRRDLGVHADPQSPLAAGGPAVVLYDRVPAGIGLSGRVYQLHARVVARAHELVRACDCEDGCPSCVGPVSEAGYGGKREALALLKALVSA